MRRVKAGRTGKRGVCVPNRPNPTSLTRGHLLPPRREKRVFYALQAAAAASASFFLISRFRTIAPCDNSPSAALTRNASRPPRCSTERSAAAVTRICTERASESEISVTLQRLGKKRVRVLRLEWLTLLPVCTALPVNSQRRDISRLPLE